MLSIAKSSGRNKKKKKVSVFFPHVYGKKTPNIYSHKVIWCHIILYPSISGTPVFLYKWDGPIMDLSILQF